MSTVQGGPSGVVTDGLVLWLDASYLRSYPGFGTTWTDLTSNNNNGTLINGPTYSSANGGTIVFDGTNDYIDCGDNDIFTPSKISIVCWINRTNNIKSRVVSKDSGPDGINRDYGLQLTASGGFVFFLWKQDGVFGTSGEYPLPGGWNNIVCTWDGNNIRMYLNSLLVNSVVFIGTSIRNSSAPLYIGRYTDNTGANEAFGGNISLVQIYNRALSAQEVLQNYNATKTRFGL